MEKTCADYSISVKDDENSKTGVDELGHWHINFYSW